MWHLLKIELTPTQVTLQTILKQIMDCKLYYRDMDNYAISYNGNRYSLTNVLLFQELSFDTVHEQF